MTSSRFRRTRSQEQPTYQSALSAFEALPANRVLFDNGAGTSPTGSTTAGDPYPGFEQSFSGLPIPGTTAQSWYFGPGGTLNHQQPTAQGVDSYTSDANAVPLTDYSTNTGSGGLWGNASEWQWNWAKPPAGSAVSYVSAPLTTDTTAIGGGAVHLWVKSSTPDVDLQATVSEVRPDGNETLVQNGWIRPSERKLATNSNNIFQAAPPRCSSRSRPSSHPMCLPGIREQRLLTAAHAARPPGRVDAPPLTHLGEHLELRMLSEMR